MKKRENNIDLNWYLCSVIGHVLPSKYCYYLQINLSNKMYDVVRSKTENSYFLLQNT